MGRSAHQEQRIVYLKNKQIYDIIRWGAFLPTGTMQEEGCRQSKREQERRIVNVRDWHMQHYISI